MSDDKRKKGDEILMPQSGADPDADADADADADDDRKEPHIGSQSVDQEALNLGNSFDETRVEVRDIPLLHKSQDSEFKLLQIVEDTIIGLAIFLRNAFYFFLIIILYPRNFIESRPQENETLPRPFTLLAISTAFSSIQSQRIYVFFEAYFQRSGSIFKNPPLQSSLESLTVISALKVTLPIVMIVIVIASSLVRFSGIKVLKSRELLFHSIIYVCCMQFLLIGLFFLSIEITSINADWIFQQRDFEDPILEIGYAGVVPLFFFAAGVFCTFNCCIKIVWPIQVENSSQSSGRFFKPASLLALIVVPLISLLVAILSEYLGWTNVTGIGWVNEIDT